MNQQEHKALLEKIQQTGKEVENNPQKARALLIDAGICNNQGELIPPYKEATYKYH